MSLRSTEAIAAIHEDARDSQKRERYVEMTLAWARRIARDGRWRGSTYESYLREEHPDWSNEQIVEELAKAREPLGELPVKFRADPIEITLHPATPLDKKYATLTAIHDVLHRCDYLLAPWKGKPFKNPFNKDATGQDAEEFAAWLLYRDLCNDVVNLQQRDLPAIEHFLTEVTRAEPPENTNSREFSNGTSAEESGDGSKKPENGLKINNASRWQGRRGLGS